MPDNNINKILEKLEVVIPKEVKLTLEPKKSGFVQRSLEVKQTLLRRQWLSAPTMTFDLKDFLTAWGQHR